MPLSFCKEKSVSCNCRRDTTPLLMLVLKRLFHVVGISGWKVVSLNGISGALLVNIVPISWHQWMNVCILSLVLVGGTLLQHWCTFQELRFIYYWQCCTFPRHYWIRWNFPLQATPSHIDEKSIFACTKLNAGSRQNFNILTKLLGKNTCKIKQSICL